MLRLRNIQHYYSPLSAVVVLASAITATLFAWTMHEPSTSLNTHQLLLAVLGLAVASSFMLRLHINSNVHIYISSIPLYLLCVCFSAPLTMAATGISMFAREITIYIRYRTPLSAVFVQVGRWMILGGTVSLVVHATPSGYIVFAGVLAALLLWTGDVLSSPLIFTPLTGMRAKRVIIWVASSSYGAELMQYVNAFLIFMILTNYDHWIDVACIPVIGLCVLLLCLYLKESERDIECMGGEG